MKSGINPFELLSMPQLYIKRVAITYDYSKRLLKIQLIYGNAIYGNANYYYLKQYNSPGEG